MSPTNVLVAHHGHCFDGMASAALITRLLERELGPNVAFFYRGLDHQPGGSFVPPDVLTGEVNAVVDFRYSTSDKLHWFFDHHVSGILAGDEREHFDRDTSGHKFFDPTYGSCCKLVVDIGRARFGLETPELADLVYWADMIDAARFPDARMPVELAEPALRLMTVIEAHGDDKFTAPRIERLARGITIDEVAAEADVQRLLAPLLEAHKRTCELIRERAREEGGVVTFDLVGGGSERYNKFIPYWIFPASRYCVAVTAGRSRAKVSVGSNPWAPTPRTHDIAALCARYGGGGHPVVGAVSLKPAEIERAREIAREIAAALRLG